MGGVGVSLLCIIGLIFIYWFPTRDRIGVESDDVEKRDESNPLYLKGMFRKRTNSTIDNLFTADLKLDFACQVQAAIQIVVLTIYGIYSAVHGCQHYPHAETVLLIWVVVGVFTHALVLIYYTVNFDKAYIKTPWNTWRPFSFTGNSKSIASSYETRFANFDALKARVFLFCKTQGYQLVYKKEWNSVEKAWIFVKMEKHSVEIFELIRIPILQKNHIVLLDNLFEIFYKKWLKKKQKYYPIYLTFFLCVDEETRTYRNILNTDVIPGIRRYRLPAGITLDDGIVQISGQDVGYGDRAYKKMRKKFNDVLGLELSDK